MIQARQVFPAKLGKPATVFRRWVFVFLLTILVANGKAQTTNAIADAHAKRVLMIFSESRDLPGNAMMEQSVRAEIQKGETNPVEFFSESLDAGLYANPRHYRFFKDYLKNKYAGAKLDVMLLFMSRDFLLERELPTALLTNLPLVFVVVNNLEVPAPANQRHYTGIFQRYDVRGTLKFIFQLQPETRRVVVMGGVSAADEKVLAAIEETTRTIDGVEFEFWTNRPVATMCSDARSLSEDTVILLSTVQRDAAGEVFTTSRVLQMLAPAARVPVYVLGAGMVGGGALGGNVVDFEGLGAGAGRLALRVLAGTPVAQIPIELRTNGTPMVDWRELQRWNIKSTRLPANCVIRYRPHSLWGDYHQLIIATAMILLAQALTISALLIQRHQRRQAEAEIQRQRNDLAHVTRVSTIGQLTSMLTHELNQPLGAILRNAEAAELFLRSDPPNLKEVQAILLDIRRDDKRAGNVIDRLRTLFKRRDVAAGSLDLRELVEDTLALLKHDLADHQVKITLELPARLPPAQGDRVQIQQVLLNLLLNGLDAMNEKPKTRRAMVVQTEATRSGNLKVSVMDNGVGISPDQANHLFEPFYTTKSKGMGMGLAISHTIIEAHRGRIWVESSAQDGTTVTFLLPPAGASKLNEGDLPTPAKKLN